MNPISSGDTINRPPEIKVPVLRGQLAVLRLDWSTARTGGEGSVVLAEDRKNGRRYACKIINIEKEGLARIEEMYNRTSGYTLVQRKFAGHEEAHLNVPREVVAFSSHSVAIVSEWAGVGLNDRLAHLARRNAAFLTTKLDRNILCFRLAHDVGHGLSSLHQAGLGWRDGKFGNVAFDEQQGKFSIVDLGLCCELPIDGSLVPIFGGTPGWQAPEVAGRKGVCLRSDLYALGLMIAKLATRNTSWKPTQQTLNELDTLQGLGFLDPEIKEMIKRLTAPQPEDRWTAGQLLEHLANYNHLGSDPQGMRTVGQIMSAGSGLVANSITAPGEETWTFQRAPEAAQNQQTGAYRNLVQQQQHQHQPQGYQQLHQPQHQQQQQRAQYHHPHFVHQPQHPQQLQHQQLYQHQPPHYAGHDQYEQQFRYQQQQQQRGFGGAGGEVAAAAPAEKQTAAEEKAAEEPEAIALVLRLKELSSVQQYLKGAPGNEDRIKIFASNVIAAFKSRGYLIPYRILGVGKDLRLAICQDARAAGIEYFSSLFESSSQTKPI